MCPFMHFSMHYIGETKLKVIPTDKEQEKMGKWLREGCRIVRSYTDECKDRKVSLLVCFATPI